MSSSNGDDSVIGNDGKNEQQDELLPFPCASSLYQAPLEDDTLDILPISITDDGMMEELPEEAEFTSFLEEAVKWFD